MEGESLILLVVEEEAGPIVEPVTAARRRSISLDQ
jgi:hypothetical protein